MSNIIQTEIAEKGKRVIVSIIMILVISVFSSAGAQMQRSAATSNFYGDFFIIWVATACNILIFPVYVLLWKFSKRNPKTFKELINIMKKLYMIDNKLTSSRFFGIVLLYYGFYMAANFFFIKSIRYSSAMTCSLVFSSINIMIFLLEVKFLNVPFIYTKLLATFILIIGLLVIFLGAGLNFEFKIGVVYALVAALFSASYRVFFKKILGFGNTSQACSLLSFIGLFNLIITPVYVVILHYCGLEILPSDINSFPWLFILAGSVSKLVFNSLVNFGLSYLSAFVITMGSILATPLNAIVDIIFRKANYSWYLFLGGALILLSVSITIIPNEILLENENKFKKKYIKQSISQDIS